MSSGVTSHEKFMLVTGHSQHGAGLLSNIPWETTRVSLFMGELQDVHSFIHSFNKYLQSPYYVPGIVRRVWYTPLNKTDNSPCSSSKPDNNKCNKKVNFMPLLEDCKC
jgi:hypothetical protein